MATINGTTGNDTLSGTSTNDTINGLGGNDTILGSTGTDFIDGGAGFDSIEYKNAANGLIVDFAAGTITGGAAGSMSFTGIERIVAGNFNDQMTGNSASQTLTGQGGNDTLWGAGGADTLWGGAGNDTFIFRETGTANADRISDWQAGLDTIVLDGAVMTALGASGDFAAGDARFWSSSTGTAHDADDRVIYNTSNGQLWYDADGNGSGAAVLIATLQTGATLTAADIAVENGSSGGGGGSTGTAGNDSLTGTAGNDSIDGLAGNDTINGLAGMDTIDGGTGIDSMVGGDDDDVYIVDNGSDVVVELEGGGSFDEVRSSVTYTLPAWVNNLTLTGTSSIDGTGNELDNVITGNGVANVLSGLAGNDTLSGAGAFGQFVFAAPPGAANADTILGFDPGQTSIVLDGLVHAGIGPSGFWRDGDARFWSSTSGTAHDADDRVIYNTLTGQLWFDADGNGTGAAQLIATLQGAPGITAANIGVVNGNGGGPHIVGTSGDDSLAGTSGNDWIEGLAGNDTLDGVPGNDTLEGGTGNDTYFINNFGDVILDAGGIDTMIGKWFDVMPDGIENLTLRGTWAEPVDWPQADGNALNNVIRNDEALFVMMDGGEGNDTLIGGSAGERFFFSAGSGSYGNDSVNGGAGYDALDFQHGTDSAVTVDFRAGTVTGGGPGGAGSVTFVAVESAIGSRFDDRLTAHDGGVELRGYLGNDTVIGGAGNDTLHGDGEWNDHGGDGPGGKDQVFGGAGDDLLMDEMGDDLLDAGTGNDSIRIDFGDFGGPQGNDTIIGGDGNDTLFASIGNSADLETGFLDSGENSVATLSGIENLVIRSSLEDGRIGGSAVANWLAGGSGRDTIEGRSGNDTVDGGSHDDAVDGGTGNDSLIGGAGLDAFLFTVAPGAANADQISDFVSADDQISLEASVHANAGAAGNFGSGDARFWSSATGTAHDADDRVIYNTSNGQLWYDADGNGAGAAQLIATLQGAPTLTAADISITNGGSVGVINGTSGNDSLLGGPGDDTINGFAGEDTIDGGTGADSLVGGEDSDTYFVDNPGDVIVELENGGIDTVNASLSYTLPAWVNNLTLTGSSAREGAGNELDNVIVDTPDASPVLIGYSGNDTLIGDAGWTVFRFDASPGSAGYGHDSVDGGGPADFDLLDFENNSAAVTVDFRTGTAVGGGTDSSVAFVNIEGAQGTRFADSMFAGPLGDELRGYGGSDTLTGGAGGDQLYGDASVFGFATPNPGNDSLFGGGGADFINGDQGNDSIDGGAGNDFLTGSDGLDSFFFTVAPGAANADQINTFSSADDQIVLDGAVHANAGASGTFAAGDARFWSSNTGAAHDADDRVIYNTSSGQLWYDPDGNGAAGALLIATLQGNPGLAAVDITIVNGNGGGGSTINGTSGNDTLSGTVGNDTINALGGSDIVLGSFGSDVIDGGAGFDSIEYKNAPNGLVVDFAAGTISGGAAGSMSFTGIERIVGGGFNDQMSGNAASQTLTGQNGNDTIAGAGAADTLWGGGGSDFFVFREMGTANADRISDFASGADKVQLDDSAFTAIGALGNFSAGDARFWAAAGATSGHDANDRVVYNTSTGSLYYDADGSGSGAAQLIATFAGNPAVAATDIAVI